MKRFLLLLSCISVLAFAGSGWGAVWYVGSNGSDGDDGQSWNSAFATIQRAVDAAAEGDEIWVLAGTYVLNETVRVNKAVSLYGGFNGSETELEQRDWHNNITTVDGNNDVLCFSVSADSRIDGFTIRNGYDFYYGGGIRNIRSSPTIANSTFYMNRGGRYGGAIYNDSAASPTIINCTFYGNSADYYYGGAIYNYRSSPAIINSTFHKNTARLSGGAIANFFGSSPTITNTTFYDNSAGGSGGGIWNFSSSNPIITNTIFLGNTAPDGPEVYNGSLSYADVAYSNVPGGYLGAGNIDADPQFVDPDNGDFHLVERSPAIDAGDPDAPSLPETDFEGDPRIVGPAPDMGVDEAPERGDDLQEYVLYAKDKVELKKISSSQGNVGSNRKIKIERGRSRTLKGDLRSRGKVKVKGSITVDGDVISNGAIYGDGGLHVINGGTITEHADPALELIDFPELSFTAGGNDIKVRKRRSLGLDPGSYGKVRVKRKGVLNLSSGEYYMRKFEIDSRASVVMDVSKGPIVVNVVNQFDIDYRAEIKVEGGSTKDVAINVLHDRYIKIDYRAKVRGTLYAPNSKVKLDDKSQLEGAVHARRISMDRKARFSPHAE